MKSSWLFGSVLILCILFLTFEPCRAQQYSPEFQTLLNQIEQNYLAQKGDNLSSLRNRYPTVVATLIGHALRQQTVHVQQNPSLNNQFTNLQREARAYIGEVARTTTARLADGSRFNPEDLWSMVNRALQGQDDGWILETFGVRTGTMPSVLAAPASTGPQPQRPQGMIPRNDEEKNQIELLGKVAKGKPGKNDDNDLTGDWHAVSPKLAAERPELDVVVRFNRQGNTYTGKVLQSGKLRTHVHPVGTVFCKLERIDEGRFYRGNYYYYDSGVIKHQEAEMEVYGTDTDFCRKSKSSTCGFAVFHWKSKTNYLYSVGGLHKHFSP